MYGSIRELMLANQPNFDRMKIRGGDSPFIRPVMPGEERLTPEMQEKMQPALPPVRKAAEEMLEGYIAQLAPSMVRNITTPSDIPYITTPIQEKTNSLLMERLGGQLTPEEMGGFVYGNYPGFSGI